MDKGAGFFGADSGSLWTGLCLLNEVCSGSLGLVGSVSAHFMGSAGLGADAPDAADDAVGAFLLGPRARFFVICVSWGPGSLGSVPFPGAVLFWDPGSPDPWPPFVPVGGGPRASMPARAGLKRSASLLAPPARPCCSLDGALVSFCSAGRARVSVKEGLETSVETRRGLSGAGLFVGGGAVFDDLGEKVD